MDRMEFVVGNEINLSLSDLEAALIEEKRVVSTNVGRSKGVSSATLVRSLTTSTVDTSLKAAHHGVYGARIAVATAAGFTTGFVAGWKEGWKS